MDLRPALTFFSMKASARLRKSVSQSILPCSSFNMVKLWKLRASVQGRNSNTKNIAFCKTILPSACLPTHSDKIVEKHLKNFVKLIDSLSTSSPSSSLAMVCGHNSVLNTGLFLTLEPDLTDLLWLHLLTQLSSPELFVETNSSSGKTAPASFSLLDDLISHNSLFT